jgi:arabinan endo-1,5-alpha-L-arabinosidase
MKTLILRFSLIAAISAALIGCGGSSNSGSTPPPTISVTPATVTLAPTQTQLFTAVETGSSNTAVTWSLSPSVGTISTAGLYTAPATVSTAQTVMVTATSANDTAVSASATVSLTATVTPTVAVTPSKVTLNQGQTQSFTATVTGSSNTAVTWSINPSTGSISTAGLYTAPATITAAQTVTVTATSAADTAVSATATVSLAPITPDLGTQATIGDTFQFTMTNVSSGLSLGIAGQSQAASAALVDENAAGATDDLWHAMPIGTSQNQYNVENMLTHQVMGIQFASTAAGAPALQYADNGTNDHLWEYFLLKDGNYLILNVNSNLYLQEDTTVSPTIIDQGPRATTGTGCTCQEWTLTTTTTAAYPAPRTVTGTGIFVHDPYMLKDPSGTYWLYGTHQTLAYSTDLTTFTYTTTGTAQGACTASQGSDWLLDAQHCPIIGPDFASWTGLQSPPTGIGNVDTDVWAPSLLYANSTYYLYYSIPYEPSTGAEAVIGLATSTTPYGPWTDKGYVVSSWTAASTAPPVNAAWNFSATTTWNAIDAAPFVDASGKWWMSFGSFSDGIHIIQLDPTTGLPLASNPTPYPIISSRIGGEEGSFIYPWVFNGTQYYYYFAPINVCCSPTSPYRTIVGRSTSPNGPFVDRGGLDLTNSGGTILLSTHGNIVGPGGGSVFTDSVNGTPTPTFVYHYYDGNNNGTPTLGINRLGFTADGWPYVM